MEKFLFIFNQFWETNQIISRDHDRSMAHDRFLAKKYQTSDWSSAKSDFHQFYMWKRLLIYKIRRSSFLILTDVKVDRYKPNHPYNYRSTGIDSNLFDRYLTSFVTQDRLPPLLSQNVYPCKSFEIPSLCTTFSVEFL